MEIRVDTTELGRFSRKLIQFRKSAFPSVTRLTLNSLAFDTKKNVKKLSYRQFTIRESEKQNVFNTGIVVDKAKFDRIETMKSRVGLNGSGRWGALSENVKKQEIGGTIDKKSMIPLNTARTKEDNTRKIMSKKKLSKIDISRGNSGKYFTFKAKNGKKYIAEPIKKKKKRTLRLLYTYKKSRKVTIKKRPFLKPSAIEASKNTKSIFEKHAKKTLKRKYGINFH